MPPLVTTRSPRFRAATMARCSFCFFCCGRISRNHMTTKIRMNGANDVSISRPLVAGAAVCAQASEMNMNELPKSLIRRYSLRPVRPCHKIPADYTDRNPKSKCQGPASRRRPIRDEKDRLDALATPQFFQQGLVDEAVLRPAQLLLEPARRLA